MLAPPEHSCGSWVSPWLQVFCNGPLYCGCPVQSESPWNPQRGSATTGAAVTIAPAPVPPPQRQRMSVSCSLRGALDGLGVDRGFKESAHYFAPSYSSWLARC
jgi:hypothetical protein